MKLTRKVVILATAGILIFSFFFTVGHAFAVNTLTFAHVTADPHPWFIAAEKFKELVEERTKGEVQIKIFPSGQLGNVVTELEGVKLGSIDFTIIGTGLQGPLYVPEAGVVSLPYMFKDKQTAYRVLDGPIGNELASLFEAKGFIHLGYWEIGFGHLTNNKRPINSVDDVAGLKIRQPEGKHWEYLFQAWKAIPVYVTYTELYSALQQGLADGQTNAIPTIYSSKVYEVQKYLALTAHNYDPASLLMNPKKFKELTPEQQKIFRNTGKEVGDFQRRLIAQQEQEYLKLMQEKGIVVTKPDLKGFMDVSQSIYEKLGDLYPKEFIHKVRAAAK